MASCNAAYTKDIIKIALGAKVTPFIWGFHGIGKSSLVRQVCEDIYGECIEEGENLNFIDIRLGNLEVGDLVGLPIESQMEAVAKTIFAIPEFWPTEGKGIIFLDELNRAQNVVLQACFSLILDRRIHRYKLPDGWPIVAAGNPSTDSYVVNELDEALFSRFVHILFDPTKDDWVEYATACDSIGQDIVSFINEKGEEHLYGKKKGTELNSIIKVEPNARAYELLGRMMQQFDYEKKEELLRYIAYGLIGEESGTALITHLRESEKAFTGKQILDDYKKCAPVVKKWMNNAQINMNLISASANNVVEELVARIVEGINKGDGASYFEETTEKLTEKDAKKKSKNDFYSFDHDSGKAMYNEQLNNLAAFLIDIPSEIAMAVVKRDLYTVDRRDVKDSLTMVMKYLFRHKKLNVLLKQVSEATGMH